MAHATRWLTKTLYNRWWWWRHRPPIDTINAVVLEKISTAGHWSSESAGWHNCWWLASPAQIVSLALLVCSVCTQLDRIHYLQPITKPIGTDELAENSKTLYRPTMRDMLASNQRWNIKNNTHSQYSRIPFLTSMGMCCLFLANNNKRIKNKRNTETLKHGQNQRQILRWQQCIGQQNSRWLSIIATAKTKQRCAQQIIQRSEPYEVTKTVKQFRLNRQTKACGEWAAPFAPLRMDAFVIGDVHELLLEWASDCVCVCVFCLLDILYIALANIVLR